MGLGIYHVGFVRSANYFFQRLQGFTPAGVAASRAPALPLRSWGLLVPSTMCDGALLPPLVLSLLLLLVWGLDPGTGSVACSRGRPPSPLPSRSILAPGCMGGLLTASLEEEGEGRDGGTGLLYPPQQAVGAPSPGVIGWLRRLAEARLGEGKECGVTAARCLWSPESQRQSRHRQEVWWPGGC